MAIIHSTTMSPTKLELLASWLPAQPWYLDQGREPDLARAGGFRLDDPRGEVGIEFMFLPPLLFLLPQPPPLWPQLLLPLLPPQPPRSFLPPQPCRLPRL